MGGIVAIIALAFLLNYFDDRLYRKEDVTDLLLLPVLGEVPQAPAPGRARQPGLREGSTV